MKTLEVECIVSIWHKNREWELRVTRTLKFDKISDKEAHYILNSNGPYWSLYEKVRSVCEKCGWNYWGIDRVTEIKSESAENTEENTMYLDGFEGFSEVN